MDYIREILLIVPRILVACLFGWIPEVKKRLPRAIAAAAILCVWLIARAIIRALCNANDTEL